MLETILYSISDTVMSIAAIGAAVFAVSYGIFFNWRKTPAGRALMGFVTSLTLWAGASTLARFIPDYPLRPWIRLIVYILVAVTAWRMVYTLWRSWGVDTDQEIESRTSGSSLESTDTSKDDILE